MNAKIYNGNVQPNHKEYKMWVNDEGVIKTWNGTEWIEQSGSGSGSGNSNVVNIEYYKINRDSDSFDETAFSDIIIACCAYRKNNEVITGSPSNNYFEGIDYCAGIAMPDRLYNYSTDNYQLVGGYDSWLENLYAMVSFYGETADYSFLEPITKEEFYNLDNNNVPV